MPARRRPVNRALLAGLVVGVVWVIPGCFLSHGDPSRDEEAAGADAKTEFEHPREANFSSGDSDYDYWEGTTGKNNCSSDADCLISGCHDSTCAAEDFEIDDDEFCRSREFSSWVGPGPPFGRCGCMDEECQWYFEDDFARQCETNDDCDGLGPPPEGISKEHWFCRDNECHFGDPE